MPGKLKGNSKASSNTASANTVSTSGKSKSGSNGRSKNFQSSSSKRAMQKEEPESLASVSEDESVSEEELVNREQDEQDDDDDDDDGVDEEGMNQLMKALGDDGLDEVGRMQLDALEGDAEDDSEEDEEGKGEDEQEGSQSEDGDDGKAVEGESAEVEETPQASAEQKQNVRFEIEDDEDEEEVALEDAESVDDDAVPRTKIVINNKVALDRIRDTIKLDPSLPWTETLTVTYPERIEVDVNDDINRELAFYKQALHGVTTACALAASHNLSFTRPPDYFAEMVKSDAHMERIRQRLLDESAAIKRSEEKRKEREGKRYGKQVQLEKIKERERNKKEMEERLKGLKRKHKDALDTQTADDEAFDVAVEEAISDRPSKRSKISSQSKAKTNRPKLSRKARDAKFGFGGAGQGRRRKQNTRESTENFDFGGSAGKGKGKGTMGKKGGKGGKPKRPGKSRRAAMRSR